MITCSGTVVPYEGIKLQLVNPTIYLTSTVTDEDTVRIDAAYKSGSDSLFLYLYEVDMAIIDGFTPDGGLSSNGEKFRNQVHKYVKDQLEDVGDNIGTTFTIE